MTIPTSIEERPKEVKIRETFGHWEMDTVIGKAKGGGPVLLVLTERLTRKEIIRKIGSKTTAEVARALNRLERDMGARFKRIFQTITIDNGSEFMDTAGMEKSCCTKGTRTKVYYCHPYSSWERGSNENANGIIRRFIPKGTPIEEYSEKDIARVEQWINNYPRKILGYSTAQIFFDSYLGAA
ncbi:MAG: IS30 family transposase [Angelakisella sp.]|nr:IS30 family transposase [Angelakisella sp.]